MMNPYLAKLHSLNFGKPAPRATDKTDETIGKASYVGFVGSQGCGVPRNDTRPGAQPDGRARSEHRSAQSPCLSSHLHIDGKSAATTEYDSGVPRVWAEALARLDPNSPRGDIPSQRWLRFIDDCGQFLDDGWAAYAARLGWGPLDLFGCDPTRPYARINRAGLLWLLNGRRLFALGGDAAAIATASGGYLTFRRRLREPGGILAWELPFDAS
jgi:hypothetical protein